MPSALYHIQSYIFHKGAIPRWDNWLFPPGHMGALWSIKVCVFVCVLLSVCEYWLFAFRKDIRRKEARFMGQKSFLFFCFF